MRLVVDLHRPVSTAQRQRSQIDHWWGRLVPLLGLALGLALCDRVSATTQDGKAAERATQAEIDSSIDRGIQFILSRQQLDGSWRPDEHKYVAGQTGLCIYTLLKGGVSPRHPSVLRGIAFLRSYPPRWTYGIACCLMALQTADSKQYAAEIREWTELLLECQGVGFSYPTSHEDLSLTQYGCLGLRAAEASGIEIPASIWESCMQFALRLHTADGAFTYIAGRQETGSMTAAGVAVLEICMQALEEKGALKRRTEARARRAIDEGVAWLGEHMRVDRNPDPAEENDNAGHMTRWKLYYLYGLERVGGLTGRDNFGARDWYAEASTHLVKTQAKDGHWGTAQGEPHPGTCFGILVLKRATAPTTGKRPRSPKNYGDDDEKSPVSLRITGDTPLSAWVSSWGRKTLKSFEWFGEETKGPRVWRVEYVDASTGEVLATAKGDPDKPARDARFAVQFSMPEPGTFSVFARAWIRPIDDDEGEELEIISPTLEVRVDGVMTEAMREAIRDFDRDVLDKTESTVKASTVVNAGHAARFVRDGTHGHGWLSAGDDERPWIRVEPDRPQRADYLVLAPYYKSPSQRGAWGRVRRVHVEVNGKDFGEFDVDPMAFSKAYLPFKKTTVVREFVVTIIDVLPGTDGGNKKAVGFAEIELQLQPERLKAHKKAAKEAEKRARDR